MEGMNSVGRRSRLHRTSLGYAAYVGNDCFLFATKVGRYTCIGNEVRIIAGAHPTSCFVSIHPAFYSTARQAGFTYVHADRFEEYRWTAPGSDIAVEIGPDAWIADRVSILNGVKIGAGAIVATGAVVVSDVQPYAIVGGVPAKTIRTRFTDEEAAFLMDLRWWDRDREWIKAHAGLFDSLPRLRAALAEEMRV